MDDDHVSPDTGQMDMSAHDQTPDMSLDTSMSIREASTVADVTEKTIRRWIKSGRLHAVKLGGQYRITVADLDRAKESDVQTSDTRRPDTGQDSPRVDMSSRLDTGQNEGRQAGAPIDLAPLVDHIASLERRVGQLTESSTMWQIRTMQAEEQLKQLTAGTAATVDREPSPEPVAWPESIESVETDRHTRLASILARLRRLIAGDR